MDVEGKRIFCDVTEPTDDSEGDSCSPKLKKLSFF